MKVTHTAILIDRDPMTKIPKVVPAWEVPVYQALFGEDRVEVGEDADLDMEYEDVPTAKAIHAHLSTLLGADEETKQAHVALAYGIGRQGEKMLQQAIDDACGVKAPRKAKADADAGDPLDTAKK